MASVGDLVPDATVHTLTETGPTAVSVAQLSQGRRIVIFAVPGAFTPACSARHLPGFVDHVEDFRDKGISLVACLAVNDAFVMAAWGAKSHADNKVMMLADGNGTFTGAMGLGQDSTAFGMGLRSQRYALIAQDGHITHLFVEQPGAFDVSAAQNVLARI